LYYGDCEADLLAIQYNLAVVDPDKIGELFLWYFLETYKLDNPKEFSILYTKTTNNSIPRALKKYFINPFSEELDTKQLKLTILNRRTAIVKRIKNKRSYDKRIFRLFSILKKLQFKNSYVTIDELSEEFNVSRRTIERDIELLRYAGEYIEFDKEKKSYILIYSFYGLTRDKFS
jgi:biotin operon repressor